MSCWNNSPNSKRNGTRVFLCIPSGTVKVSNSSKITLLKNSSGGLSRLLMWYLWNLEKQSSLKMEDTSSKDKSLARESHIPNKNLFLSLGPSKQSKMSFYLNSTLSLASNSKWTKEFQFLIKISDSLRKTIPSFKNSLKPDH